MVINNPPTGLIAVPMIYRYWPIITAYGIVQKTNLLLARFSNQRWSLRCIYCSVTSTILPNVSTPAWTRVSPACLIAFLPANRYLEEEQQLVRFW